MAGSGPKMVTLPTDSLAGPAHCGWQSARVAGLVLAAQASQCDEHHESMQHVSPRGSVDRIPTANTRRAPASRRGERP